GGRAEIPFGAWRLSLAAALAKAGGLLDTRADPAAVFLYRGEPAPVAARLGVGAGPLATVPVVFRLDLSDPAGFLLATRFPMRNGDLLYVADARGAEVGKALDYFGGYLSTAVSAGTAAVIGRSALSGSGTTGLPTIGGLAVVPSGVTGLPGTVTPSGLVNGVSATAMPTGGTSDSSGTAASGTTNGTTRDAATLAPLTAPRSTMTSPASR
ncbi:MAG: hypothetical protein INR64_17685, partial [Caulobacteraceae bacterium]|nr:hypothetical protein [Caulobacter sp.]